MKAVVLVKTGDAHKAFEIREMPKPKPGEGQVLVKVEGFGLNFADTMARKGEYQDAPPMPSVIGYDVVGVIDEVGTGVTSLKVGDRVTALTRFGGYAEYAVTDQRAASVIPADMEPGVATALTTQYCTAYYCAAVSANIRAGETVLIHSAAGGVGTALMQYALHTKCIVIATTGSDNKVATLKEMGAHHVINTSKQDFLEETKKITKGAGVDAIFDAVGGDFVKKGVKALGSGGRIVCYGAAQLSNVNVFAKINQAMQFGFYHPVEFMLSSKGITGVNMLRIADNRPDTLKYCLEHVIELTNKGVFKPVVAKIFKVSEIAEAHMYLEGRKSTGKVTVMW
jgi:NADPH:quinone reductase-like Zn-dependent oxidoreductase